MPTAPPPSRDVALETRVFWERFKKQITAALLIVLLAVIAFTAYRFYSDRRAAAASALLASAKNAQEYQQVILRYANTPAAADAYLLLAETQRNEKKFAEANTTLQTFIAKYPQHELLSTARMALLSQVHILKAKDRNDDARRICETVLTQYRTSFWAGEAMQQLRLLKPSSSPASEAAQTATAPPLLARPPAAAPPPAPQAPPPPKKP